MKSDAPDVDGYLAALPDDRRSALATVRTPVDTFIAQYRRSRTQVVT